MHNFCINVLTIKGKNLERLVQLPFLCMVESSMLHVSALHAGHLQAFTEN